MSEAGGSPFLASRNIPLKPLDEGKLQEAIGNLVKKDLIVGARMTSRNRLHVSYDASCVGIRDLLGWLDEAGIEIESGLAWKLKSALYEFLDENAKSNAKASGGACCNRPPPGRGDA